MCASCFWWWYCRSSFSLYSVVIYFIFIFFCTENTFLLFISLLCIVSRFFLYYGFVLLFSTCMWTEKKKKKKIIVGWLLNVEWWSLFFLKHSFRPCFGVFKVFFPLFSLSLYVWFLFLFSSSSFISFICHVDMYARVYMLKGKQLLKKVNVLGETSKRLTKTGRNWEKIITAFR